MSLMKLSFFLQVRLFLSKGELVWLHTQCSSTGSIWQLQCNVTSHDLTSLNYYDDSYCGVLSMIVVMDNR